MWRSAVRRLSQPHATTSSLITDVGLFSRSKSRIIHIEACNSIVSPYIYLEMEAVGLASSIITFIEAGFRVYGCYSQIRASTSGATAINEHIETITRDLKAAVQPLETANSDQSDNALYRLAQNCRKVSKELIEVLGDLRPSKPGRLRAFAKSIKAYWREDAIRRLNETLMSYRQELALHLQILMV